jgi:TonB family protein
MLAVLKETDLAAESNPGIADLKQLGEGFLKLTDIQLTPAEPAQPAPAVARPAAAVPVAFYTAEDTDVAPPTEIVRQMPAWNPPIYQEKAVFSGKLQIDIDERGVVERAVIVESIAPSYDGRLLAAARAWKFEPATKDGVAVKYRKTITIALRPQVK